MGADQVFNRNCFYACSQPSALTRRLAADWPPSCAAQRRFESTASLEASAADLRTQLESARAANQTERTRLEERHAAAEAHWLTEVDRARQSAKEQDRQAKELRSQVGRLHSEGDQLRQHLTETRSELKTATAVREQLEERLRAAARISDRALLKTKSKPKGSGKPRRPSRSTRAAPKRTSDS